MRATAGSHFDVDAINSDIGRESILPTSVFYTHGDRHQTPVSTCDNDYNDDDNNNIYVND